jgi:hypothetical protein
VDGGAGSEMGTFREHALKWNRRIRRFSDIEHSLDQALCRSRAHMRSDSLPGKQGVVTPNVQPQVSSGRSGKTNVTKRRSLRQTQAGLSDSPRFGLLAKGMAWHGMAWHGSPAHAPAESPSALLNASLVETLDDRQIDLRR